MSSTLMSVIARDGRGIVSHTDGHWESNAWLISPTTLDSCTYFSAHEKSVDNTVSTHFGLIIHERCREVFQPRLNTLGNQVQQRRMVIAFRPIQHAVPWLGPPSNGPWRRFTIPPEMMPPILLAVQQQQQLAVDITALRQEVANVEQRHRIAERRQSEEFDRLRRSIRRLEIEARQRDATQAEAPGLILDSLLRM